MTGGPIHEPPWLTEKVDRRLAQIELSGAFELDTKAVIATYLAEGDDQMSEEERTRWERTCDSCGRYCSVDSGIDFYTGFASRIVKGRQVLMAYGVCDDCRLNILANEKGKA